MCKGEGPVAHSPKCVYRHALLLAYLAYRGMVDHEQNPKAADLVAQIPAIFKESWTQDLSLDAAEKRFMKTPFGKLTFGQRSEASWLIERLSPFGLGARNLRTPSIFHPDPRRASERLSRHISVRNRRTCQNGEAAQP